jgi:uncharacterized protein (TIGR03067 family)
VRTLGTLTVLGLAFVPGFLQADDSKDIQGVWSPVEAALGTQKMSQDFLKTTRLRVANDQYEVVVGKDADRGRLKLDSGAKTKAMDIIGTEGPNKGKTFLAIYELKGDTLRICYDLSGEKRPTDFKTGDEKSLFLVTYKRVKK